MATGGGGYHRDTQGVVVARGCVPPLGLLQDVLRVVHGDHSGVGDEVGQDQPTVVMALLWDYISVRRRVDEHTGLASAVVADQVHVRVLVVVQCVRGGGGW